MDSREKPAKIAPMAYVDAVSKFDHAARTKMVSGWQVIQTDHGLEREDQRSSLKQSEWDQFIERVIKKIEKFHTSGEYLFFSVSMRQAVVMNLDIPKKQLRAITVLPTGRNNPRPGTKKILIESKILTEINWFKQMEIQYEKVDLDSVDSDPAIANQTASI
jgi:hypothetical protein